MHDPRPAPDLTFDLDGLAIRLPYPALHRIAAELRRLRRQPYSGLGEEDAEDAGGIVLELARAGYRIVPIAANDG